MFAPTRKVKNNTLYREIRNRARSVRVFCNGEVGKMQQLYRLINLRISPFRRGKGANVTAYRAICLVVARRLSLPPEYLFPNELYEELVGPKTAMLITRPFSALPKRARKAILALPVSQPDGVRDFEFADLRKSMAEVLKILRPNDRSIVELRHGLVGGLEHTFSEIGRIMGSSSQDIQQKYQKAMQKLRCPCHSRKIETFL